jgi:hypothetical protein
MMAGMRDEDRRRLEEQRDYPDGEAAARHLEEILGLKTEAVRTLVAELQGDLDPTRFGIGWWHPYPDDKRRILISDHLIQCTNAIIINLSDAALHYLEYLGACQREDQLVERMLGADGTLRYPKPSSPADLLPARLMDLHRAGFFRALGSTLDCLSAVAVGVLAIPMTIVTADFSKLRDWLRGTRDKTALRHRLQTDFGSKLESFISAGGPAGWVEWVDSYRNMLVHRARRLTLALMETEAHVLDPRGRPIPRVVPVTVLPNDPSKSDIQAMVDSPVPVLKEDGRRTMWGAFESIRFVAEHCAKELCSIWANRRTSPSLIHQPREQWTDLQPRRQSAFNGYEDRKLEISVKALMTDPTAPRRLEAAALTSDKRPLWDRGLTG